ncbi:hypothetical protein CR983_01825 [Candidatus Saccharibacteria bacterium]|nr:MAG: hypothetical protein CR983_01825 [Candidatus Saccharibacteria bacterium]
MALFSFLDNIVEGIDALERMATKATTTLEQGAEKVETASKTLDAKVSRVADRVEAVPTTIEQRANSMTDKVERASRLGGYGGASSHASVSAQDDAQPPKTTQPIHPPTTPSPKPQPDQPRPAQRSIDGMRPRRISVPPRQG